MRIGVDAGALSIHDDRLKNGVYWVNVNLLYELAKIDSKNTYYLYSFVPIDKKILSDFGPRMINKVIRPTKGWYSVSLPLELIRHPVDIFLGLSQAIPSNNIKNIGFIYDFGFFHYPDAYPESYKKVEKITNDLIKRSNHIVTISNVVKNDIVTHYGKRSITVSYPGVDKIFTSEGPKHKEKNPYFLFVGALKRSKNIPFILRAFAKFLKQTNKPRKLLLVGSDYWLDSEISKTINTLNLQSQVKQLSYVSDTKLAQFYRGAVAFISPSLYEGFCLPAAEAMSCGTPVIASTNGSFPEVVGNYGALIDPYDEDALVHAMKNPVKKTPKQFLWSTFAKTVYSLLRYE